MDVDPFPRIYMVILVIYCLAKEETQRSFKEKEKGVVKKNVVKKRKRKKGCWESRTLLFHNSFFYLKFFLFNIHGMMMISGAGNFEGVGTQNISCDLVIQPN
jgi:hypothetical protein